MKYFELAKATDTRPYFAQFADDATLEDEGHEHHGIAQIRAWRTSVPNARYDVRSVVHDGNATVARVDISGDFPGSPVELLFSFEYADDGRIAVLRIR